MNKKTKKKIREENKAKNQSKVKVALQSPAKKTAKNKNIGLAEIFSRQVLLDIWKKYSQAIIISLVILISIIAIWNYLQNLKTEKIQRASLLFQQVISLETSNSSISNSNFYKELIDNHGDTFYGLSARLIAAKNSFMQKNYPEAIKSLNYVIDNADDEGLKQTAQISMLKVMLDSNPANMFELLQNYRANAPEEYQSQYSYLMGLLMLKQEKFEEAYRAFNEAASDESMPSDFRYFVIRHLADLVSYAPSN